MEMRFFNVICPIKTMTVSKCPFFDAIEPIRFKVIQYPVLSFQQTFNAANGTFGFLRICNFNRYCMKESNDFLANVMVSTFRGNLLIPRPYRMKDTEEISGFGTGCLNCLDD
jgi:hypothetical protein